MAKKISARDLSYEVVDDLNLHFISRAECRAIEAGLQTELDLFFSKQTKAISAKSKTEPTMVDPSSAEDI